MEGSSKYMELETRIF